MSRKSSKNSCDVESSERSGCVADERKMSSQMTLLLSQITIACELKSTPNSLSTAYRLSDRADERSEEYALIVTMDSSELSQLVHHYWRLNLQIKYCSSAENEELMSTFQCESIPFSEFQASQGVQINLKPFKRFDWRSLTFPIDVEVSALLSIPQTVVDYLLSSDHFKVEPFYSIPINKWSLNELHFLSFINRGLVYHHEYDLICKELMLMNRWETNQDECHNDQQSYSDSILVFIDTITEIFSIDTNDKDIRTQIVKHLIPQSIPDANLTVTRVSTILEAYYFGEMLKIMVYLVEPHKMCANITIETENIGVLAAVRRAILNLFVNYKHQKENDRLILSSELQFSSTNELLSSLDSRVMTNKDVRNIYMKIRRNISQKLPII